MDYAVKTRQALAKWNQKGSVIKYIVGFSEWHTQCTNVNEADVLFCFVDGLSANI